MDCFKYDVTSLVNDVTSLVNDVMGLIFFTSPLSFKFYKEPNPDKISSPCKYNFQDILNIMILVKLI